MDETLIAAAVRILNFAGVMGKSGHVSARDPGDPGRMRINSQAASRSSLVERDVVLVDLENGARIGEGPSPPTELHIHRSIYRARPDVGAIVHAHPQYVVALSVAGRTLVPVTVDGGFLPRRVPLVDSAEHVDTPERGDLLAAALGSSAAVVLRGHGIALVAGSVEVATCRAILAEDNARTQYLASVLGEPRALSDGELERIGRHTSADAARSKAWRYQVETARKAGALEGLDVVALEPAAR